MAAGSSTVARDGLDRDRRRTYRRSTPERLVCSAGSGGVLWESPGDYQAVALELVPPPHPVMKAAPFVTSHRPVDDTASVGDNGTSRPTDAATDGVEVDDILAAADGAEGDVILAAAVAAVERLVARPVQPLGEA